MVIKAPVECWWESEEPRELRKKFYDEVRILEILGKHRNIAQYELDYHPLPFCLKLILLAAI